MRTIILRTLSTLLFIALHAPVHAQGTDIVEVASGDRMTGTVSGLERGRLAFNTPAASPFSISWAQVVTLTSTQTLDVELASGERFIGTIASPSRRSLVVQTATGPSRPLDFDEIVRIASVASGFLDRTSGSIDFGLNFAEVAESRTYSLTGVLANRGPDYEVGASFDSWLSARNDADTLTRNKALLDVRRQLGNRWFALGLFELQQNSGLELDLRLVLGGGVGRRLVQSNTALFTVQGGFNYNAEEYADDDETDQSAELFGGVDWDWFGHNIVTVATTATTYISLERERARLEIDADVRRDMFWRLYWSVNVSEDFDSDPPGGRDRSDLGISLNLGWAF